MKKQKILSIASLFAGTLVCAHAAGYYDDATSGKSYSQSLADFERDLDIRAGRTPKKYGPVAEQAESERKTTGAGYYDDQWEPRGDWSFSLGVEGFYALSMKDLFKSYDDEDYYDEEGGGDDGKIDLYGASLRFTARKNSSLFGDGVNIVPEFYGIVGVGYGEEKYSESYWENVSDWGEYEDKLSVFLGQVAIGANLRWIPCEYFSLFGGIRAGASYISVKASYEESGVYGDRLYSDSGSETKDGFGFLYGAGIGCDFAFGGHHALTLSADYLVSTAKADFYGEKTQDQHYCVFSVGYKYTF